MNPRNLSRGGGALLVFSGFLILYLTSLSPNLGAAHDGVYYLRSIESGLHLLHPHHLLYNSLARGWWRITGGGDAVFAVESLNAIVGAFTVALVFLLARRHRYFWACLWGASFGAWFYSSTIEVYILPLPFLIAAFALGERGVRSTSDAVLLGILHAGAVLHHQTNLLLLPCLIVAISNSGGRLIAVYLIALILGAGLPYLSASLFLKADLAAWSTTYLRELDLGHFTLATPIRILEGVGRFFVGGHFLFATPLRDMLSARLGGEHHLADEIYLVSGMNASAALALLVATGGWFAGVAWTLARCGRRIRATTGAESGRPAGAQLSHAEDDRRVHLSLAWFMPYAVFFSWWEPNNVEFWIATLLPLFLAASTLSFRLGDGRAVPAFLLALIPLTLLAINYCGSIRFLKDPTRDWYRKEAAAYARFGPGDRIELDDDWIIGPYIERLTGAEVVK